MIRSRTLPVFALIFLASLAAATASDACVGRKLVLGAVEGERPAMVSRILSILIHDRTGTTVEVKYFPDAAAVRKGVEKGKVDLYVDFVDRALGRLGETPAGNTLERWAEVKRRFDEEKNLVWLKPMGFGDPEGGQAATVVRKDTLKKFPALPRLLEKIGTRIILDDSTLDGLVARGHSRKPARVARDYLKEVKLI